MAGITIVNGVYKPTYNWGAPSCGKKYGLYNDSYGWICISNPTWCWRLGSYVIPSYEIWWDKVGCKEKERNKSTKDRNKTISHIGLKTTLGQVNIDAQKKNMGTPHENSLQMVPRQTDPSFNNRLYIYIYLSLSTCTPMTESTKQSEFWLYSWLSIPLYPQILHQGWLVEHQTPTGIICIPNVCNVFLSVLLFTQFEWLLGYIQ